ncbi:MAG: hypothetical protein ABJC26_15325 [Gemmatimonadaceae bacterium]
MPTNVMAVSPTEITGVVGAAVSDPPAVRVTDQNGSPVAGVRVTFGAALGAGMLSASAALTDSDGVARSGGWILGAAAGRHAISAQTTVLPGKSVTFSSTGLARGLKTISRYAGNGQFAEVGTSPRFPLAVFASDTFGNPIVGIPISFAVVSGGGTIDETVVTTNADGVGTSSLMKLGPLIGDQRVEASTAGLRTTFALFARRPLPSCIVLNCPGSRLAFVRDGDIYSAFADGTDLIRLAPGSEPAWSTDGRIAFTGTGGVYVMNDDGSNVRLVAPGGSSPAWSPDAQRLAVATRIGGQQTIDVVTPEAPMANPVRVGFDRGINGWPTWSPDGSRIAFASDWIGSDFALEVFVFSREARSTDQLTDGDYGSATRDKSTQPAWSPDGTKVALMECPASKFPGCANSYLVVRNLDGTEAGVRRATQGYVRPNWSPNGKWITFDGPSGIQFISANGLEQGLLIPNAQNAAWRP